MIEAFFDLRSRFRSRLLTASALERIGLLAGAFFLASLPIAPLLAVVIPGFEGWGLFQRTCTAVLWGVGMHSFGEWTESQHAG
jgi:hypothetical protein